MLVEGAGGWGAWPAAGTTGHDDPHQPVDHQRPATSARSSTTHTPSCPAVLPEARYRPRSQQPPHYPRWEMLLRRFLALLGLLPPRTAGLDNGLGRRPLMGWSSWNNYAMSVNQSVIHRTIDSMVSTGLAKAGWEYVLIDDGWAGHRDASGRIVPGANFPDMKGLADHAHRAGLKLGIYSARGNETCGHRPGSAEWEELDAKVFAEWGIVRLISAAPPPDAPRARALTLRPLAVGLPEVRLLRRVGPDRRQAWRGGHGQRAGADLEDARRAEQHRAADLVHGLRRQRAPIQRDAG